jgi:hypothetical protein
METGIIPNFYNQVQSVKKRKQHAIKRGRQKEKELKEELGIETFSNNDDDSVFSDDDSSYSRKSCGSLGSIGNLSLGNGDHMAFFKRGSMIKDNRKFEERHLRRTEPKDTNKPSFYSQFEPLEFDNPSDPVSHNNVPKKTGKYSDMRRLEMERNLAMKGNYSNFEDNQDMTYGVVDPKDFVHNNMVPNFKRGIGKGYGVNSPFQNKWNEVKQRKMELFTGSLNNPQYRQKTERRPLFNPHVGNTWIYGMPNFTDYYQSRFIPGRERKNEKLMQPVRITPGLNLNYNEISKQGFHDLYRALPKSTDQTRLLNDPKISYGRPLIHGMKGTRRGIIPNMAKRRPVTAWEKDPRDFVKGTTYYRAPAIYGNYDAPSTGRQENTRAWYSAPNIPDTFHKPSSMYGKFRISHKENFLSDTPRNITGIDRSKNASLTSNSYYLHPTNRQIHSKKTWLNPAGPEYQKDTHSAYNHSTHAPDPTCKDLTINNTYIPRANPEYKKTRAFEYDDIPEPTLRNLTEINTYLARANPEWKKKRLFNYEDIPDNTLRDLTPACSA